MRTATLTEARRGFRALIDFVRAGENVVITDRGRPVATLGPVPSAPDVSGRLMRLERAGLVKIATASPPVALLRTPPPPLSPGASSDSTLSEGVGLSLGRKLGVCRLSTPGTAGYQPRAAGGPGGALFDG
jgi:prevent-host-death family protein